MFQIRLPFSVVWAFTLWKEKKLARAKMVKAERRKLATPIRMFKPVLRFILFKDQSPNQFNPVVRSVRLRS